MGGKKSKYGLNVVTLSKGGEKIIKTASRVNPLIICKQ